MINWLVCAFVLYALVHVNTAEEDACLIKSEKTVQLLKELCDLQKNSRTVAFQAEASTSLSNLTTSAVVIFDKVSLNAGNAYDPKTGIFTTPDAGIYSFTWTVMTIPGSVFHTDFAVDGRSLTRGYLDLLQSRCCFSSTKNILVELQKGNKAWVQASGHNGRYLWGGHNGLSTFNGFKL